MAFRSSRASVVDALTFVFAEEAAEPSTVAFVEKTHLRIVVLVIIDVLFDVAYPSWEDLRTVLHERDMSTRHSCLPSVPLFTTLLSARRGALLARIAEVIPTVLSRLNVPYVRFLAVCLADDDKDAINGLCNIALLANIDPSLKDKQTCTIALDMHALESTGDEIKLQTYHTIEHRHSSVVPMQSLLASIPLYIKRSSLWSLAPPARVMDALVRAERTKASPQDFGLLFTETLLVNGWQQAISVPDADVGGALCFSSIPGRAVAKRHFLEMISGLGFVAKPEDGNGAFERSGTLYMRPSGTSLISTEMLLLPNTPDGARRFYDFWHSSEVAPLMLSQSEPYAQQWTSETITALTAAARPF